MIEKKLHTANIDITHIEKSKNFNKNEQQLNRIEKKTAREHTKIIHII